MFVDPLQWSKWWIECCRDIVQVLGRLTRVWGSCWGLLGIMYHAYHHHLKSLSLVVSKNRGRSVECCLLLWRPMALYAHPICANVDLWGLGSRIGRPMLIWGSIGCALAMKIGGETKEHEISKTEKSFWKIPSG